ncbi:MAG: glycosyltransferase family 1 protein [Porticoccaceae bacterium]
MTPIDLIFTCDALKPPLTGIGYYAAHLLEELLAMDEIGAVTGLGLSGFIPPQVLAGQVESLLSDTEDPVRKPRNDGRQRALAFARKVLDRMPAAAMALRGLRLHYGSQLLRAHRNSLLHAPNYIAPNHDGPTVITVHDLSHIRHPETHPAQRIQWLDRHLPRAVERAQQIICVSDFTRQEMLDLGLVRDASKLSVCHNGCDPGFHPRAHTELAATLARWQLQPGQYILSVATLEPRKNLEQLLAAYQALPGDLAGRFPLVLSGSPGWKHQQLTDRISKIKLPHRVVVTGYQARECLQQLMAGAGLFAYLSIYEGFGLPVIEAMASGVPVLTANSSALREVTGDCGYTVDPENVDVINETMAGLLQDHDLAATLRHKGLQRAAAFTWSHCARQTVDVYGKALGA